MNQKIFSVQYLRGIAALLVVMYHFSFFTPAWFSSLFANGMIGVDVFFIISGFIIYFSTNRREECSPSVFLIKRIARIYPLFLVALLANISLLSGHISAEQLIRGLLVLHNDYTLPAPAFGFNLLPPAWTLTYELAFYALFCLCAAITPKYRGPLCIALLLAIPAILQIVFNGSLSLNSTVTANPSVDSPLYAFIRLSGSTMFYEFAFGIMAGMIFERANLKLANATAIMIAAAVTAVFFYFFLTFSDHTSGIEGMFFFAAIFFVGVLMLDKSKAGEIKALSILGDLTYSLYLCHWLVMQMVQKFIPIGEYKHWGVLVPCMLVASLMMAFAANRIIEKPFIRLARSALKRQEITTR
ncbi:acyltransferase family protein [Cronobacter turicensis]|nr:acyltransferase [Cronobacter turicensis]